VCPTIGDSYRYAFDFRAIVKCLLVTRALTIASGGVGISFLLKCVAINCPCSYPMNHRGAAENVAMNNHDASRVAEAAVNGWIDSPGEFDLCYLPTVQDESTDMTKRGKPTVSIPTSQNQTRTDKARQDKRTNKIRTNKIRTNKKRPRQNNVRPSKTRQTKTKKTRHTKTYKDKKKQDQTKQERTKQDKDKTRQGQTRQNNKQNKNTTRTNKRQEQKDGTKQDSNTQNYIKK